MNENKKEYTQPIIVNSAELNKQDSIQLAGYVPTQVLIINQEIKK